MNAGQEHQPKRVHEQVTLSALQAFASIKAPLRTTHARSLHALAVNDGGAGLKIALDRGSHALTQFVVQSVKGAGGLPAPELTVNGLPGWKVHRQEPPGAAGTQQIEDGFDDASAQPLQRSAEMGGRGQQRNEQLPLGVGQIGGIRARWCGHIRPHTHGINKCNLESAAYND